MLRNILSVAKQIVRDRRFWHIMRICIPFARNLTREIDYYVTQGRINKAKQLIRKQSKEKVDEMRKILIKHKHLMSEETIQLYKVVIMEIERSKL